MSNQAQAASHAQSMGLPLGVRARQAWRPSGVRAVESLMTGISLAITPFMRTAARFAEWHDQFTQRVQPPLGWSPMSLVFPAKQVAAEGQMAISPPAVTQAPFPRPNVTARESPTEKPVLRPALQLVSLQTMLSPQAKQRHEVRGGFPLQQPEQAWPPESEQTRGASTNVWSSFRGEDLKMTIAAPASATTSRAMAKGASSSSKPAQVIGSDMSSEAPNAMTNLLERIVEPVAMPGLELRLVSPAQPVNANQHSSAVEKQQALVEKEKSSAPAPPAPPAPPLDINAVADKVYQTLMRRQQLERERRGLY